MTIGEYEWEQRLRESDMPFWKKLQWLEDASLLAMHLRDAPRVAPPDWVQESLRAPRKQTGDGGK